MVTDKASANPPLTFKEGDRVRVTGGGAVGYEGVARIDSLQGWWVHGDDGSSVAVWSGWIAPATPMPSVGRQGGMSLAAAKRVVDEVEVNRLRAALQRIYEENDPDRMGDIAAKALDVPPTPAPSSGSAPDVERLTAAHLASQTELIGRYESEITKWRAEVERLKRALGTIAELGDRCEECDPPDTMATHVTAHVLTGMPITLCAEHAEEARAAHRKAESKGCGPQPEVEEHEQDTAVTLALAALFTSQAERGGDNG